MIEVADLRERTRAVAIEFKREQGIVDVARSMPNQRIAIGRNQNLLTTGHDA